MLCFLPVKTLIKLEIVREFRRRFKIKIWNTFYNSNMLEMQCLVWWLFRAIISLFVSIQDEFISNIKTITKFKYIKPDIQTLYPKNYTLFI